MARLHFFYGTMGAAKSTKLIQDRYNFVEKGLPTLVIKPEKDRTTKPIITSRIGLSCPAEVMHRISCKEIINRPDNPEMIFIDEVQFFTPKDIDELVSLADNYCRYVFCYGLMTDINEELFPASKHLIEVGAKLHELPCSCQMPNCRNLATHHVRYRLDGSVIYNGSSVEIDNGHIKYKSVCRKCYDKEMQRTR